MTSYSFLPLRAEFVDNSWRALDRCVYRYVISLGGSTLLAELAAHCSLADGLGHSALSLADTVDHAAVRPLSDGEHAALCREPLVGDGTLPTAFVVHDGRFYLWRNFANERAVATALAARIGTTTAFRPVDPDLLAALFADSAPDHVAQQRLAVARVVQHRLLVLTGAPGTGKTTTVLRMLLALRASARGDELAIGIAAPTGKAAQRLAQSLREGAMQLRRTAGPAVLSLLDALPAFDASTLHRLLGYQATTQSWRSGRHKPLDADVVIVDEASMIDLNLLRVLLQSLRADTTLILVGDPDQLASIDSGATLGDIVTGLNTLAHSQWVRLEHVFRASSDLQPLLDAVRIGDHDAFTRTFAAATAVFSRHRVDDAATLQRQVARWAGALATRLRPALATVGTPESAATALQLLAQRQLLCALRDGPYGAHALAQAIEQRMRIEFNVPIHAAWFPGRSVIIGENDYTHGLFNGDIGIALADADGTLRVWFAATDEHGVASMRALLPDLLPPHEGAGAITIHKAQGSEYAHIGVVLPPDADSRVLSRQLLYTALSRARSSIELWGEEPVMAAALQHAVRRVGGLAEALVTAVHAGSASASDEATFTCRLNFVPDLFVFPALLHSPVIPRAEETAMKLRHLNALLPVLLACSVARATEVFCVDSVSEFNAAYAVADEENVEIHMVTGTYDMTDSCIETNDTCDIDDDVIIRGGYAPGCGSRVRDASATVLTRPGGGLTFYTAGSAASGNGDLLLESLTFRNVPQGIRIGLENTLNPDAALTMRRVWFDQSGKIVVFRTSAVFMYQSMVTRSSGSCAIAMETDPDDEGFLERVLLRHVTIAGSDGDGLCIGSSSSDDLADVTMFNSILWDNVGDDLVFDHPNQVPVNFYSNTYATLVGGIAGEVSGTVSTNPQFVSPATGNFELGGSSSVNSGFPLPNSANDFDIKGDGRVFSIAADRGALESAIGSTATTLTVTSTADAGLGTLRQALLDANLSPSFNRIVFDIGSTCGPKVINIMSPLPAINTALHIDGYTQTGAARNTRSIGNDGQICIVLQQGNGSTAVSGLVIASSADPEIALQIEGLGFSNFLVSAVSLAAGNGHSVLGSQFGGVIDAVNLLPSGYGVTVVSNAVGVQIGGPDPGDRNTFGEAVAAAINLTGSFGEFASQALVQNNYIGLAPNGSTALPNDRGIVIYGDNHEVRDNVISSNDGVGILIDGSDAHDNLIRNNLIGLIDGRCTADCERGNGSHGIHVSDGATRNTIRENTIAHSGGDGVAITSASGNPVFANSMFNNTGEGIDLGDDSLTLNDSDSSAAPSGAGNLDQNYPQLTTAGGTAALGSVSGTLSSVNAWYRLDFYGVSTCPGFLQFNAGADRLYTHHVQITNATGGNDGSATFNGLAIARIGVGDYFATPRFIVATATRMTGNPLAGGKPRHTSEFGPCRAYVLSNLLFSNSFE